jgi:hypothetical protein
MIGANFFKKRDVVRADGKNNLIFISAISFASKTTSFVRPEFDEQKTAYFDKSN